MGPDEVRAVLERYPAGLRPLSAPEPLGNAGGLSGARLWRFRSGAGPMVLRAWPMDWPGRLALERIQRWLDEARGLGFVPVPLPGLDGRGLQDCGGRIWELAPWLPGAADLGRPPDPIRVRAGFAGLAAFHRRLARHRSLGPSPGLARRLAEVEALRLGGLDRLADAIDRRPAGPIAPEARRWIALARRLAPAIGDRLRIEAGRVVPLQPCLRDARPDHFLFEGDRLAGLVDFGAMGVESVAGDLSRLASDWLGPDRGARAGAIASYSAIGPLAPDEVRLIEVFDSSTALLGPGHWVRWHFEDGRTFDDPDAVARGLHRGLGRLELLIGAGT